jgi:hypothetical protein
MTRIAATDPATPKDKEMMLIAIDGTRWNRPNNLVLGTYQFATQLPKNVPY